ncbi:MAG: hypothetical protein ABI877_12930 [Gemmatimonadaceae bacterium]
MTMPGDGSSAVEPPSATIDSSNPVVALCVAGMELDGLPGEAHRLFVQAWEARRDDYDAAVAAHFLARHQSTPADALHWNALAVRHAEALTDGRADEFFSSLCLNLADSFASVGEFRAAVASADRAAAHLPDVRDGGYRRFVERGIHTLQASLRHAQPHAGPERGGEADDRR